MRALADRDRGEGLQGARVRDGHVARLGVGVHDQPLVRRHEDMRWASADFPACDDAELVGVYFDSLIGDRKSTRLNSSHSQISYAVFCLKKKKKKKIYMSALGQRYSTDADAI